MKLIQDDFSFDDLNRIEICEERFALSASLPGDLLLEALSIGNTSSDLSAPTSLPTVDSQLLEQPASSDLRPDLLDQAAEIRNAATIGSGSVFEGHSFDGSGQTVAVIDSGVAWDHVAFGGGFGPGYRVVGGWDFAENDANPYDDGPAGFHGTHVAGLLAGKTDDFAGVAPGADIVALRVFDDTGMGELDWIEASLKWVHDHRDSFASPITTVNLSVGAALNADNLDEAQSILEDELQLLRQDGILVFAASGNFFGSSVSDQSIMYPASSESVVAVGSIGDDGLLSTFSQRNDGLLATGGESIRSAVPEHVYGWDGHVDDFATLDGTSMATPQIAAASMLVRQSMIDQGLNPSIDDILMRLRDSTQSQTDPLTGASYNVVDLSSALLAPSADDVGDSIDSSGDHLPDSTNSGAEIRYFPGSNENDSYVLDLTDGIVLRSGGNEYRFETTGSSPFENDSGFATSPLVIDVGGGADSLHIIGSNQAERLIMHPGSTGGNISTLSTNRFQIELRGVESLVFDGGGGPDRASLYDSPGDDTLRSGPNQAELSGVGFQFNVNEISKIFVHATAGGYDTAFMTDSAGDDTLAVKPQFTSLRSDDTFQAAYGFERVFAYATAGGHDNASLYDSAGDDTMNVSAARSIITGPDYQINARGFESVEAFAINGGVDTANIYADEVDSQWHRAPDRLQWTGQDGTTRIARQFERVQAFEQYEPIPLSTQSIDQSSSLQAILDNPEERLRRERLASQSVFDLLGRES
ncbi:Subtilisin E precursor [Novipirellula aureliae]|uniref:Subtilisin E n=1 Tax=Novipirellula aureliae TaxID=2527966 RepID=A0A5C6DV98_9BACT|nr:S8 family serine peptidase [Novipirellula aureliae]TWU39006.1 Subtilisin E precursor [Novipirellula aureliae]